MKKRECFCICAAAGIFAREMSMLSQPSRKPLRICMPRELSLGLEKASSLPDMMLIISAGLLIERVLKSILPTVEKKRGLATS